MKQEVKFAVESLLSGAPASATQALLRSQNDQFAVAIATAIKDMVVSAGFSDHPQRERAIEVLAQILRIDGRPEIEGLLHWVKGLSQVVEGNMPDAVISFERAESVFIGLNQPLTAAETQIPKLVALANLGRVEETEACSKRIRAVFVQHDAAIQAAKVELNLGSMMLQQDRFREAEAFYRSAAAKAAQCGDMVRSVRADCGLASALTWQHLFDDARLIHERVIARATRHNLHELVGISQSGLARLELFSGNVSRALSLSESWLRTAESLGSEVRYFDAQRDIADVYCELNLLPEAAAALEKLQSLATRNERNAELPWIHVQLGRALAKLGNSSEARSHLSTALTHYNEVRNTFGAAYASMISAEVALQDQDFAAAHQLGVEAASVFDAAGVTSFHVQALEVVARVLFAQDQLEAARACFSEMREKAERLSNENLCARALSGLGQCTLALKSDADAEALFSRATAVIERRALGLPSVAFQCAARAEFQAPYDGLIQCALLKGDDTRASALRVLELLEFARGLANERAFTQSENAESAIESEDDAKLLHLRRQLNWTNHRIQLALAKNESASDVHAEAIELERAITVQFRRQESKLKRLSPSSARTFNVSAILRALRRETVLVQFHCLDTEIVIVVLSQDNATVARVDRETVDLALEKVHFQLQSPRVGSFVAADHSAQWMTRINARLRTLYSALLAPIAAHLTGFERIVFVPHGALHTVPWSALIAEDNRPLVETHEIAVASSASTVPEFVHIPRRLRTALVVTADRATLPYVAAESAAVARAFESVTQLDAANATLTQVAANAKAHDVLHFACHGSFRADSPSFSALHLDKSALAVFDAECLALNGALVTLSACESAVSDVKPGEELTGLASGFLRGGARTVIASGWPVNDETTSQLMSGLYVRLCAGISPGRALMLAQREVRALFPHPYFWASFSLLGAW